MEEVWKSIDGSNYEVSNYGKIRNANSNLIRRQHTSKDGYYRVGIRINGKLKTSTIHRLVAEAFIPNPHNYTSVNHIDECKANNRVDNLEWCTPGYNTTYGTAVVRASLGRGKRVLQFNRNGDYVSEYPSPTEAQKITGVSRAAIYRCCRGNFRTGCGYVWKYA